MQINVTLNHLQAFVATAEQQSFRAAATELGLSQPAVTARIQQLEARLGLPLFHRTTRSVELTAEGERLLATARRLVGDFRGMLEEMRQDATLQRGRVTVAAPPSVTATVLPRAMAAFHRDFPGIEIILRDVPSDQAIELLGQGAADLAILSDLPPGCELVFEPLFEDEVLAVLPKRHALARRAPVPLAALGALPLLVPPRGPTLRAAIERVFAAAGIPFRPAHEALSPSTLVGLVEAGCGVAFVPRLYVGRFDFTHCRLLPIAGRPLVRRMGLVRRPTRSEAPASAGFRAFLGRTLRHPEQTATPPVRRGRPA